jgi:hypothetical protein
MSNDKLALAKKLRELALHGSDGEREAAQATLDKILKKYDLSLNDIDDEQQMEYRFKYHGEEERRLLRQISNKVFNEKGHVQSLYYSSSGRKCSNTVAITCTKAQYIEIEALFDFYKRLYEKEKELFFIVFVHKHKLFDDKVDDNDSDISDEDILRMRFMMAGLSDNKPHKQLEESHTYLPE